MIEFSLHFPANGSIMIRETDLYAPVKQFFEGEGYEVKSEITNCDVVACKDGAPTVIIELKIAFSLELVFQGVERQKVSDDVYLAVQKTDTPTKRRNWRRRQRSIISLCRRLGLGLLLVDTSCDNTGRKIQVLLDPAPYRPQKNARKQTRLKREFLARSGDPNTAGVSKKTIVTAYRQDAIRCARPLEGGKVFGIAEIREASGVSRAGSILQKNHYGWFERAARGVYRLSAHGEAALQNSTVMGPHVA